MLNDVNSSKIYMELELETSIVKMYTILWILRDISQS